jgi:hypothetical protein
LPSCVVVPEGAVVCLECFLPKSKATQVLVTVFSGKMLVDIDIYLRSPKQSRKWQILLSTQLSKDITDFVKNVRLQRILSAIFIKKSYNSSVIFS